MTNTEDIAGDIAEAPPFELIDDDGAAWDDARLAWLAQNDLGNGERLRRRFGDDMIFVVGAGWHHWDDQRFARQRDDLPPATMRAVHEMVRAIDAEIDAMRAAKEAKLQQDIDAGLIDDAEITRRKKAIADATVGLLKWARASGNTARIDGALRQARPYLTKAAEEMDVDPFTFNCENGTIDMFHRAEGQPFDGCSDPSPPGPILKPHAREDRITMLAPVKFDLQAACPRWLASMEMCQPDPEMCSYLQRLGGYTLTGDAGEQILAIHYGDGANGKSTYTACLSALMGDYATTVDPRLFMAAGIGQDASKANPGLAKLRGIRGVFASEPSEDSKLGEDLIKAVTGGTKISTRDLFAWEIEYRPKFKLHFDTNHKPQVRGFDLGIWRRLHTIPWLETIPERSRIKDYWKILIAEEGPGILLWFLQGAVQWRMSGLRPPATVLDAVESYKREMDPLADFMDAATFDEDDSEGPTATELFRAYAWWCQLNAREAMTGNRFGRLMTKRGRPARKCHGGINRYPNMYLKGEFIPPADWEPGGKHHAQRGQDRLGV